MAATIIQTPSHAYHNHMNTSSSSMSSSRPSSVSAPSFMDAFNDGWRNALKVHGAGGTTAAIASAFNNTSQSVNTTTGMGMGMVRTDVFPQFDNSSADCSPSLPLSGSTSTGMGMGYTSGTTQMGNTSTNTSGMDVSDADTTADGLDFSSSFSTMVPPSTSGVEWSTNVPSSINGTTNTTSMTSTSSIDLPALGSLKMRRDDSLLGRSIGFEAFAAEIDAAPSAAVAQQAKTPSSAELFGSAPIAFDVAPAAPSPTQADGALNFDLTFPGFGDIIGAIPTTHTATSSSYVPSSSESVDEEPDASSVTDVDADSWSVSSGPSSPVHAPLSPISRMVHIAPIAPGAPVNPNASLALRPGPYTRGRAAALAAPAAPRELKPVPVARGPHAGLLGGGEMASVGIYTKDDRWRKIERLREKRRARIVVKSTGGQYACRKSFADRRPRIGGRFVKMDDETKKYLSATKPGAAHPSSMPQPAALRAYQQQQQAAAIAAAAAATAATYGASSNPQLAVAAHAASHASPMAPLFGSSSASLPPAPSWPAAPVNTTSSSSMWYGEEFNSTM